MKSLSSKTYQCGVTIQGLTTLSGTVYLTGITNTASWDHVIVGTTAQGQIYTRTYAQFMGDVAAGISLSSYVTGSGTTNYLPKFTGGSALGNSQIFDNGTNVGIGTASPSAKLHLSGSGVTELRITSTTGNTNSLLSFYESALASWGIDAGQANGSFFIKDLYNSATRLTISYTGNVGIGTTSPSHNLHLYGAGDRIIKIENTGTYLMYVGLLSNEGYIGSTNATPLGFYTNNVNRIYINTSGNVGIGTTSPAYKFQVAGGDIAIDFNRYLRGGSGGDWNLVNLYNGATGDMEITMLNASWYLRHNANASFAGSVGIGTTNPSNKLDVTVNLAGAQRVAVFKNTYSTGYTSIAIDRPNTARYSFLEHSTAGTTDWYVGTAYNGGGGNSAYQIGTGINTSDSKLFITTGGNVGIGTASPSATLHVVGASIIANNTSINPDNYGNTIIAGAIATVAGWALNSAIGGNAGTGHSWAIGTNGDNLYMGYSNGSSSNSMLTFLQVDDNTRNVFLVPSAGNVGIGTASPSYKLDVSGALRATGTLYSDNGSLAGNLNLGQVVSIVSSFGSYANLVFTMHNGGGFSDIMKLQGNGNVGIGTTSPSDRLTVAVGNVEGIRVQSGNSGFIEVGRTGGARWRWANDYNNSNLFELLVNDLAGSTPGQNVLTVNGSNGYVGIGTITPSTKLDVNGVITATDGNSTNWNTAYGWGNHASASYVPQARTLTINGTSYDLSANRTWTIATSANIQEAANNGKVTTAASVGTTVITTVATATYDGATFNYVLKDGTNYRAGTIIAVWSAGAVQFNETTTNDIGSTVGVTFTVALNAGNAELRATSATPGWTVKVVTIGI